MAKYKFPAKFETDNEGGYSVNFPDLPGCYTCGDSIIDAINMAEDVLALVLYGYETDGKEIPTPSSIFSIPITQNSFVDYITCDTTEYKKR